ncbi:hypothetical protein SX4_1248 [Vibrio mimicus SX-4]|nr:hypothetical protein SX4_1248 [Vibrio mimicus SX-4]
MIYVCRHQYQVVIIENNTITSILMMKFIHYKHWQYAI